MNERALKSLEFDKIRAQCATHTASDIGREFVADLLPADDLERARMLLRQTWEADGICRRIGGSPIDTFPDARSTLRRVNIRKPRFGILEFRWRLLKAEIFAKLKG